MAEAMARLWKRAVEQGYKIKAEMEEQGIIDAQILLAQKEGKNYRQFNYKGRLFTVKRGAFGWNLYEVGDVSK